MKKYLVEKTDKKGKGLFASKDIKKGELIFSVDLSKEKSYSRNEINNNPKLQSDHCDYIGNNNYVVSFHPYSYMNHSCNPNILIDHKSMTKSDFYAMKDIWEGEELNYDYGANALEGFNKNKPWEKMKCNCGSKNCRKIIYSDFFKLPKNLQKKYYKYLPQKIKKKYNHKLKF